MSTGSELLDLKTNRYYNFISLRINRTFCNYYVKHHIIPKSFGGKGYVTGKKKINNGKLCKYVPIDELDYWLNNGWIKGNKHDEYRIRT